MVENGIIVDHGSYDQLIKKNNGFFANFIKTYLDTKEANIEDISNNLKNAENLSGYYNVYTKCFIL